MAEVLIIDDEPDHRSLYRAWLELDGHSVIESGDGREGFARIATDRPACVIIDYYISGENGFVLLHEMIRDIAACPPVIFLTCALTESLRRNAMALGAAACFEKSTLERPSLLDAVRRAILTREAA